MRAAKKHKKHKRFVPLVAIRGYKAKLELALPEVLLTALEAALPKLIVRTDFSG
jgi:hypothetical protein